MDAFSDYSFSCAINQATESEVETAIDLSVYSTSLESSLGSEEPVWTTGVAPYFNSSQPLDLRKPSNLQEPIDLRVNKDSTYESQKTHLPQPVSCSCSYLEYYSKDQDDDVTNTNICYQQVPEITKIKLLAEFHLSRFESNNSDNSGELSDGIQGSLLAGSQGRKKKRNLERNRFYKCEICGKRYRQVRDYRAHLATHRNGKVYRCDICLNTLETTLEYISHLEEHQQRGLHSCHYCKKYFRDKCTLNTHLRIHTGEKPYQCKICGKKFRQSGTFQRHQKLHEHSA